MPNEGYCLFITIILCALKFRILSVKSVREEFLQHRGIERLKEEEKELFKKIVLDLYALYNSKQQEQNDEQGMMMF